MTSENQTRLEHALEELLEAADRVNGQHEPTNGALWVAVDVNNGQVFGPFISEQAAYEAIRDADFTNDRLPGFIFTKESLENDGWLFTPLMGVDKAEV